MNGLTATSPFHHDPAHLRRVAEQVRVQQQQSLERLAAKAAARSPASLPAAVSQPPAPVGPLGTRLDVRA
jgi:hypothetical protein